MPNPFPTFPEALAEASPYSLQDLSVMDPERMGPQAELAYIEKLREQRLRYEKSLGEAATKKRTAKVAKSPSAILGVTFSPDDED